MQSAAANGHDDRRTDPRRPEQRRLRIALTDPEQIAAFRDRLRTLLGHSPIDGASREAVVLAASEAVNNAFAACADRGCLVEASVSLVSGYVCVEVRDAGSGLKGACIDLTKVAGETEEHGRGLHLMDELMESLELVPRDEGTLVRMTRRLGDDPLTSPGPRPDDRAPKSGEAAADGSQSPDPGSSQAEQGD